MKNAKPYLPPDFTAEHNLRSRQKKESQQIVQMSSAQIRSIRHKYEDKIAEIQAEHAAELEKSIKESYDAGYEQGIKDSRKSVNNALENLKNISEKLLGSEKSFLINAEKHVISLALSVAKKIIHREAGSDKEIAVTIVKESLARVADKVKITIMVNPDDLENILSHRREFQEMDKDFPELEFLPDEKLDPGECIVETRTGSIDGRFASQVAEIERKFGLN